MNIYDNGSALDVENDMDGVITMTLPGRGSLIYERKTEVPREVRDSNVRRLDKFRRDWPQH